MPVGRLPRLRSEGREVAGRAVIDDQRLALRIDRLGYACLARL